MKRAEQIEVWEKIGMELKALADGDGKSAFTGEYEKATRQAEQTNAWFTRKNVDMAVSGISKMLGNAELEKWLSDYPETSKQPLRVGIIMAGNIPLAGFHDLLCVLLSGHIAVVKQSSSDKHLLPLITGMLFQELPELKDRIVFADKLNEVDAVIATGSNNTARYFEYYFSKKPHIFRKNRNSVAVITGNENEYDLILLGRDIFSYFGLGCRNVSKLYVPDGYQFDTLYQSLVEYADVMQHSKYMNNHDYHQALYLLNSEKFLTNNFLIIREDKSLSSPVGVLNYETYRSESSLGEMLESDKDKLQCIVRKSTAVSFGQAQFPDVWDYADGVDTMRFLMSL